LIVISSCPTGAVTVPVHLGGAGDYQAPAGDGLRSTKPNIANGSQQVNNTSAAPNSAPRAGENSTLQNKLLEEKDGKRLDPRAACTPSRADPEIATVGEVDRAQDRGR